MKTDSRGARVALTALPLILTFGSLKERPTNVIGRSIFSWKDLEAVSEVLTARSHVTPSKP